MDRWASGPYLRRTTTLAVGLSRRRILATLPGEMSEPDKISAFITRWEGAQGAERANYQLFLTELCDALDPAQKSAAGNLPGIAQGITLLHEYERSRQFQGGAGV